MFLLCVLEHLNVFLSINFAIKRQNSNTPLFHIHKFRLSSSLSIFPSTDCHITSVNSTVGSITIVVHEHCSCIALRSNSNDRFNNYGWLTKQTDIRQYLFSCETTQCQLVVWLAVCNQEDAWLAHSYNDIAGRIHPVLPMPKWWWGQNKTKTSGHGRHRNNILVV